MACRHKEPEMFGFEIDLNPFDEEYVNEGKCSWLFHPEEIRTIFKNQLNMHPDEKEVLNKIKLEKSMEKIKAQQYEVCGLKMFF